MAERELLQKARRGSIQERPPHAFAATDHFDQLALVKRLEHLARPDAANLFDLGAANGLAVGDDRESLERGGRKPLRSRRNLRALDHFGEFRPREYLPTTRDFDQLDAVAVVIVMTAQ